VQGLGVEVLELVLDPLLLVVGGGFENGLDNRLLTLEDLLSDDIFIGLKVLTGKQVAKVNENVAFFDKFLKQFLFLIDAHERKRVGHGLALRRMVTVTAVTIGAAPTPQLTEVNGRIFIVTDGLHRLPRALPLERFLILPLPTRIHPLDIALIARDIPQRRRTCVVEYGLLESSLVHECELLFYSWLVLEECLEVEQ